VSKLNIKPGDLIEWVYEYDNELVVENEEIWSMIEERWVPIGSSFVHMCISVENETISWLNEKGLFRVHVDDIFLVQRKVGSLRVVPHVHR